MERGFGLIRCEAVDKRIKFFDLGEAAREFAELAI